MARNRLDWLCVVLSSEGLAYALEPHTADQSPSEWRASHPNGLSERQFETLSSGGLAYALEPHFIDRTPSEER
jgi:hypothetical protein